MENIVIRGARARESLLRSLVNLSRFFKTYETTPSRELRQAMRSIERSIEASIEPLQIEKLLTHFVDQREETLFASTINRIDLWQRSLKEQKKDLSERMDDIIDRDIHPVVKDEIKREIKREKGKGPLLVVDSRISIAASQPINIVFSGAPVPGAAAAAAARRRRRMGRSVAIRAAWRLRPAFQGGLRLIPSIVAGMGKAIELIRKYLPGLVPMNVNRDTAMTVLTQTPGMLNLFADLVESVIQKGEINHPRQWNPVRMLDTMVTNQLNAMLSLSSWVWGIPRVIDTGRARASCGRRPGGGGPGIIELAPVPWGLARPMVRDLRLAVGRRHLFGDGKVPKSSASSQQQPITGGTDLAQVVNMTAETALPEEPPKKRQKIRCHEVRQRWVEHVSAWDVTDIQNIITQTAARALSKKSIF